MKPELSDKQNVIFADAYHAAAMQGADIQALAATLEPLRRDMKVGGDTLTARGTLDTIIGGNSDARAEAPLLQLRQDFIGWLKQAWITEMEQALQQSEEAAWTFFLTRYAEALAHWRTQLAWWWAEAAAGAVPEQKKHWFEGKSAELSRFRENGRHVEHARWPEAYPFLRELAQQLTLTPFLRAHLWSVCGSIQMYYNTIPDAEHDLEQAAKLFPRLPYLAICRADLERILGHYESSRALSRTHLTSHPKDPEAYIALGRSFLEEKNWDEAARCFEDAIAANPGNSGGYRNKMALWGKDETLFATHKQEIDKLRALADKADPDNEASNMLEAGYTFQAGGDAEAAYNCFQQLHEGDPSRLEPIVALGYLRQQEKRYDEANEFFKKALDLAPQAVDGYWNLAALCAEQAQYAEAAGWYEKALPHCPMFARTLRVKAGEMYIAMGDFEKGMASCLEALELDPQFDFALNTLHDLSDTLRDKGYGDGTGMEPAVEVLRRIRAVKGDSYKASFHNRVGNIHYYFADYQNAAEHYRQAISTDSSLAVYHDNLTGALDKLSETSATLEGLHEALHHAQQAARLEPSNEQYRQQASRLERKLVSLRHFGVLPDERSANTFSIRVRFRDNLTEWFVQEGNLAPNLLQKIENLRERFKQAFGITLPGIRFSTDWNIVESANFVIDLDGIPMQQGWLDFGETASDEHTEHAFDYLLDLLEQNVQLNLADFIHYDSPEISAKFVGKSATYASGFFQLIRMLLKQKISVVQIDVIQEIYESGLKSQKSIQTIAQDVRNHPSILPYLPVNTASSRTLLHLTAAQEEEILSSVGKSIAGQLLWQIRPSDPTFFQILEYLPKNDFVLGGAGHFVTTQHPQIATLLNDLSPGTFFSRGEILHLTDAEKAALPT